MTELKKAVYALAGATILLFVGLGLVICLLYFSNRARSIEGQKAHSAICIFVKDLEERIDRDQKDLNSSLDFQREHPTGIPGISANVIKASILIKRKALLNEENTAKALRTADCS